MFSNLKKLILLGIFVILVVFGYAGASWASGLSTFGVGNVQSGHCVTAGASDSNGSAFFGDNYGIIYRWTPSGGFVPFGTDPYSTNGIVGAVSLNNGSVLFLDGSATLFTVSASGGFVKIGQLPNSGGNVAQYASMAVINSSGPVVMIAADSGYRDYAAGVWIWSPFGGITTIDSELWYNNYGIQCLNVTAPGDGSGIISMWLNMFGGYALYSSFRWTPSNGLAPFSTPDNGPVVGVGLSNSPGTAFLAASDGNFYKWNYSSGYTLVGANPAGMHVRGDSLVPSMVIANDGSVLYTEGASWDDTIHEFVGTNIVRYSSSEGIQNTGINLAAVTTLISIPGMPYVFEGNLNSTAITGINLTWSPVLQSNSSQAYWNQQINYAYDNFSSFDFHVLTTELDSFGNVTSTTQEYDAGSNTTFSVPMQSGKYYNVQWREVSPVSTGWSLPVSVWNAPAMADNGASIAQVTPTTSTIKWEQVAPNQQMAV